MSAELRIVRGEPTAEELAAITALVTAAAAGGDTEAPPPARGRWGDPRWSHQQPLTPGPGAWRSSAR